MLNMNSKNESSVCIGELIFSSWKMDIYVSISHTPMDNVELDRKMDNSFEKWTSGSPKCSTSWQSSKQQGIKAHNGQIKQSKQNIQYVIKSGVALVSVNTCCTHSLQITRFGCEPYGKKGTVVSVINTFWNDCSCPAIETFQLILCYFFEF